MELGRRERKKLQTREALDRAALSLFAEHGYDATTVEQISDAADVSARTFFRYFATKDDVLFSDHPLRLQLMEQFLADRPADEPIMRSLHDLLVFVADDVEVNRDRVLIQAAVARSTPGAWAIFCQHHAQMVTMVAEFVAGRMEEPDPRMLKSRVIASAAIGAIVAASLEWSTTEGAEDLRQLVDESVDALSHVMATERV